MIKHEIFLENKYIVRTEGEICGEYSISIDSRSVSREDAFVALDGVSFRGIHFVEDCLKVGVVLVVVNEDEESRAVVKKLVSKGYTFSVIYVNNTMRYFQEIAHIYLKMWKKDNDGIVIGITGSNGKTTGKGMLFHIIESFKKGEVWCTHENFNNHIGVPLTILGLKPKHKVVIVEMGTNHPGELERLCKISLPDAGFITNIGESHLEFFHNRQGVFKEKKSLYNAIKKNNGYFVINQDDKYLKKLDVYEKSVSCGESGEDVKLTFLKNGFELNFKKEEKIIIENRHIKGQFNYFNMGMCTSLCLTLFPEQKNNVVAAARVFVPSDFNRSNWISMDGKDIFLDAYNANPSSMMAALEFFIERGGGGNDSLFILGDMNELGARSGEFHQKIGAFLAQKLVKEVVFIGHYADEYNKGFGGNATCCEALSSFKESWSSYYLKHKKFFIKGSRSLQLESLIDIKE